MRGKKAKRYRRAVRNVFPNLEGAVYKEGKPPVYREVGSVWKKVVAGVPTTLIVECARKRYKDLKRYVG